ncbi:MAG: hypothetical protein KDD52_03700 [Bdellovibrionales bacterium]|nr:hypothetical protein [Bdellovibrionales bacterium]
MSIKAQLTYKKFSLFLLMIGMLSSFSALAQQHVSCTQGLAKSKLATIYLIGEKHGPKADKYWENITSNLGSSVDYFAEGACKDAPEQAQDLISASFPDLESGAVHPAEKSDFYIMAGLIAAYDQLFTAKEFDRHIKNMAKLHSPRNLASIKEYVLQSASPVLQNFEQENGVVKLLESIEMYQETPLDYEYEIGIFALEVLYEWFSNNILIPKASLAVKELFQKEEFSFEVPSPKKMNQSIEEYNFEVFVAAYQDNFEKKENSMIDAFIDFFEKLILQQIKILDPQNKYKWNNKFSSMIQNHSKDLSTYNELMSELSELREQEIAKNIYSFLCSTIEIQQSLPKGVSFRQKDIYVRLGIDHIDNIEAKLFFIFGKNNINIDKKDISSLGK